MIRGARTTVVAGAIALLVAACGSSGGGKSSSKSGEAAKPAAQIVADAAGALRGVHAFKATGTFMMNGKPQTLSLTIAAPTKFAGSVTMGDQALSIIRIGPAIYLKANAAFFKASGGPASLVEHWLRVPASAVGSVAKLTNLLMPATLARCLTENPATLSVAGTSTVNGQAVVVVKSAGDKPGSAPGELDVATSGTPYPLRQTATGLKKPGGKVDVCNDGKGDEGRSSVDLSDFNSVPAITAPANAEAVG